MYIILLQDILANQFNSNRPSKKTSKWIQVAAHRKVLQELYNLWNVELMDKVGW